MNYYEILGIKLDADLDEIKSAYRQKALKWHPDRNPNNNSAKDKFIVVAQAYEILSNPEKRKEYDDFLNLRNGSIYQFNETISESLATEMFINEMVRFAIDLASQTGNREYIEVYLIEKGCPENIAKKISLKVVSLRNKALKQKMMPHIIFSILLLIIGLIIQRIGQIGDIIMIGGIVLLARSIIIIFSEISGKIVDEPKISSPINWICPECKIKNSGFSFTCSSCGFRLK